MRSVFKKNSSSEDRVFCFFYTANSAISARVAIDNACLELNSRQFRHKLSHIMRFVVIYLMVSVFGKHRA